MKSNYINLFSVLSTNIDVFINEVKSKKSTQMATKEWTVKEVLCHIVFWHENYAANYNALANKENPQLPEGMSTINVRGVTSLKNYPTKALIERLQKAQASLYTSIVEKSVPQMTYSKGGRTYSTDHFLEMIARHITTHTNQVKKAK